MDTALPQKCPFILNRNLAMANCTGNRVCTSCDIVVLDSPIKCHRNYVRDAVNKKPYIELYRVVIITV